MLDLLLLNIFLDVGAAVGAEIDGQVVSGATLGAEAAEGLAALGAELALWAIGRLATGANPHAQGRNLRGGRRGHTAHVGRGHRSAEHGRAGRRAKREA